MLVAPSYTLCQIRVSHTRHVLSVPGSQGYSEHQVIVRILSPHTYVVPVGVVTLEVDRHLEGQQLGRECEGFFVRKTFIKKPAEGYG